VQSGGPAHTTTTTTITTSTTTTTSPAARLLLSGHHLHAQLCELLLQRRDAGRQAPRCVVAGDGRRVLVVSQHRLADAPLLVLQLSRRGRRSRLH
jgi:hypothetical protein